MSNKYIIGTRGSLLAVTQCTLIKNEMTKLTGSQFELNKIVTQGDQQVEKPLWQMDGKDFFTKELDTALLKNDVDLVVHSYKDLGSDRPDGIGLATITERKYANDILLIKKETISKISNIKEFCVGTSSPRRIVNVESSLKDFLPGACDKLSVKCKMLRGNVNTRIQKLKDDNYHAIVLAFAGLERLAGMEDSMKELTRLLDGLTFMVMPQKVFPSSASQGALAIEYNSDRDDQELLKTLKSVHHEVTAQEMKREREAFQTFGGGCHLAVGINVRKHKDLFVNIQKGIHDDKPVYSATIEGVDYSKLQGMKSYLPMGEKDLLIKKELISQKLDSNSNYFVTSKYCIDNLSGVNSNIVSSGNMTAKRLVKAGFWVNASAEGFGHGEVQRLNESKALALMLGGKSFKVLSHSKAQSVIGDVVPCYTRVIQNVDFDYSEIEIFYWSSFFQYKTYTDAFPEILKKQHACGLGKTYDQFLENKIQVTPFVDIKSFKELCPQV